MLTAAPVAIASELEGTPYVHRRALARGGTGDVHVVEHRALGGEVVMKIVRAPDAGMQAMLEKRLLAEGRMLRRLRHPNVVEVIDFGFTKERRAYLVMELLAGQTLKQAIVEREGPMPVDEAIAVLDQVLAGLEAAHAAGLVHRDLKPDNVFYLTGAPGAPRRVKVLDFGIAKVTSGEARDALGSAIQHTQEGIMVGTPMYIAPEQIACKPVDARTDVYAAGGVFYFLLTGRPPFRASDQLDYLKAHLAEMPDPPSVHAPGLHRAVDAFVLRALEKHPAARFASASEMRRALRALPRELERTDGLTMAVPARPRMASGADHGTVYQSSIVQASRGALGEGIAQGPRRTIRMDPVRLPQVKRDRLHANGPRPASRAAGRTPPQSKRFVSVFVIALLVALAALAVGARCVRAAERLRESGEVGYVGAKRARGSVMSSSTTGIGPKGTFRMTAAGVDALATAATAPQSSTDDITLRETPFDLGAIARDAVARPPVRAAGAESDVSSRLTPGTIFKGYVVSGLFAEGGLSLLYEATHPKTLRRCLIKVLKEQYRAPHHTIIQKKHIAEGKLLMHAAGRYPYLVVVHDVGDDPEIGPYYVMDKLEGRTLHSYIRQQHASGSTFEPDAAVRLGILVAEALHGMHEQGVVHRDVKPLNIFILDARGGVMQIVILDWGAAKSPFSPHTSLEDVSIGTAAYMAPEQILRGITTGAVDQFALALVLLEMMWRHPHIDDQPRDAQTLARMNVRADVPTPPSHLVPPRLFAILARALEKDYRERYPSCLAFAEALRDYQKAPEATSSAPHVTRIPHRPTLPKDQLARDKQATRASTPSVPIVDVLTPCRRIPMGATSDQATLVVLSPPDLRGLRFELGEGHVVGRHPGLAHIVFENETVSNRHARIDPVVPDPDAPIYTVTDLGSTNGTLAQERRIGDDDIGCLRVGDAVAFGDVRAVLLPAGRVLEGFSGFERRAAAVQPKPASGKRIEEDADIPSPSFLVIRPPQLRGQRIQIGDRGTIGGDPARADVVVHDGTVSGRHASYTRITGGGSSTEGLTYLIEDAGSTNGMSRVSDDGLLERVSSHTLHPYNVVRLGAVELMLLGPGRPDAVRVAALAASSQSGAQPVRPPKTAIDHAPPPSQSMMLPAHPAARAAWLLASLLAVALLLTLALRALGVVDLTVLWGARG